MSHEVYVFGDSHWRVFFPFLNTGEPGVFHEERGIVTLDTTGSELSGATMWGLLHEDSERGARKHVLATLDDKGGVQNVGLVFGEVDMRYHNRRYFRPDNTLMAAKAFELVTRYRSFIDEDLLATGRVKGNVFVYFGFHYPLGGETPAHFNAPCGNLAFGRMETLRRFLTAVLPEMLIVGSSRVHVICPPDAARFVSDDGVHLRPEAIYGEVVLPAMERVLNG